MTRIEERWCAVCAVEASFERFDCAEHPADCLELVCTQCGLGLELGGARPALAPAVAPAARQRRAREVAA